MSGYINVSGQVKKVKSIYINVGGQVKKVLKGYVGGADGVPQLFYKSSTKYNKTWSYNKNDFINAYKSDNIFFNGSNKWRADWQQPDGAQIIRIPLLNNIPLTAKNIHIKINNITDSSHTKTTIGWYISNGNETSLFENTSIGDIEAYLSSLNGLIGIFGFYYKFYFVTSAFDDGYQIWENIEIEYEVEE